MLEIHFPGKKEEEEVIALFHLHPVVFARDFLLGAVILLLPFIILYKTGFSSTFYLFLFISILLAGFFLARSYFLYLNNFLLVTNLRAIFFNQKGFFHKEIDEVYLEHTCQIEVEKKGVLATTFNFGDISVQTETVFKVRNLETPYLAKRVIFDILQDQEKRSSKPSEKSVILR